MVGNTSLIPLSPDCSLPRRRAIASGLCGSCEVECCELELTLVASYRRLALNYGSDHPKTIRTTDGVGGSRALCSPVFGTPQRYCSSTAAKSGSGRCCFPSKTCLRN